MTPFHRSAVVAAPLDDVWAFHADVEGLRALTPGWSGLEIDAVIGPDGERDPTTLAVGTEIEMRVRPLGLLPGPSWTSLITHRERRDGEAVFRDTMIGGPFETWEHTHRFRALDGRTLISDRLDVSLPPAYEAAMPAVRVGLAALFAYRHHRTRTLLEDQGRVSATVSAK